MDTIRRFGTSFRNLNRKPEDNNEKYARLLHIPTREEREAKWRKPEAKEEEWYATDEDIKRGLKAMAFPSQNYERVNDCVVIADNAIVVCFKERLPYPIDVPIVEGVKEHVAMKKWANDTVLDGIEKAEKILLSRQ